MLSLQTLRIFLRVSDLKSFSQAATALGITQPTVSRAIKELEDAWGGQLFYRTGHGIAISEFGQLAQAQARSLLFHADQVTDDLVSFNQQPTGPVSFGLPYSMVLSIVPQLVKKLRVDAPGIRMRILEGFSDQIERWLSTGDVEVAILSRYKESKTLSKTALFGSYLRLAAPPGAPTLPPEIKFSELKNYPLVLPGHPHRLRTNFEAIAKRQHISLTVIADTNSIVARKRICEQCGCYMIVAPSTFSEEVANEGYSTSLIVKPATQRHVALATTHYRPLSRAARLVADQVSQILAQLSKQK